MIFFRRDRLCEEEISHGKNVIMLLTILVVLGLCGCGDKGNERTGDTDVTEKEIYQI